MPVVERLDVDGSWCVESDRAFGESEEVFDGESGKVGVGYVMQWR
jgi:hypothetical protein